MEGRQDSVGIEMYTIEVGCNHLKEHGHHVAMVGNGSADGLPTNVEVMGIMVGELAIALTDIVSVTSRNAVHGGNQIEQNIAALGAEAELHIQVLLHLYSIVLVVLIVVPHTVDEDGVICTTTRQTNTGHESHHAQYHKDYVQFLIHDLESQNI